MLSHEGTPPRYLVAGASGLIGSALVRRLRETDGHVRTLTRGQAGGSAYSWDPARGTIDPAALEWADSVISLNGASLSRLPWTASYRRQILRSRVDSAATIARAIAVADSPPRVWVSASAVGIYGSRPGETLTEESARGTGFLADVVQAWEAATGPAARVARVVLARTGIVLAPDGALRPLVLAARLGLGGDVGGGQQHWPWIALADEVSALAHLAGDSALAGPVNLVAPQPATAGDITREVARQLHRPHWAPMPAPVLRAAMGAAANELLLADQLVRPVRLEADGFRFTQPELAGAVAAAL